MLNVDHSQSKMRFKFPSVQPARPSHLGSVINVHLVQISTYVGLVTGQSLQYIYRNLSSHDEAAKFMSFIPLMLSLLSQIDLFAPIANPISFLTLSQTKMTSSVSGLVFMKTDSPL